jgi:hypothetical protein
LSCQLGDTTLHPFPVSPSRLPTSSTLACNLTNKGTWHYPTPSQSPCPNVSRPQCMFTPCRRLYIYLSTCTCDDDDCNNMCVQIILPLLRVFFLEHRSIWSITNAIRFTDQTNIRRLKGELLVLWEKKDEQVALTPAHTSSLFYNACPFIFFVGTPPPPPHPTHMHGGSQQAGRLLNPT